MIRDVIEIAQLRERVAGLEGLADELMAWREEIAAKRHSWREAAQRKSEAVCELRLLFRQARMLAVLQETGALSMLQHGRGAVRERQAPRESRKSFWDGILSK